MFDGVGKKKAYTKYLFILSYLIPFLIFPLFRPQKHNKFSFYPNYCNYSNDLYRGSSKRDVLMLAADSYSSGLEIAIKTLRSTGCQAKIIIFASPLFFFPDDVKPIFDQLDILLINNCSEKKGRKYVPHMIRFEYELEWLTSHISEVDRVFHSDAFDVLFQKDPFSPEIKTDRLLFVLEPHCIRSCGWNLAWINRCYNESVLNFMRHQYIICSGSIIGGAKPYLELLKLLVSQPEWTSCYDKSLDQAIMNVIVWTGKVKEAGIKYDLTGCNGNFLTLQWCMLDQHIPINDKDQITSLVGTVPAFLHQYNRLEWLTRKFYQKCKVFPIPLSYNHNG